METVALGLVSRESDAIEKRKRREEEEEADETELRASGEGISLRREIRR